MDTFDFKVNAALEPIQTLMKQVEKELAELKQAKQQQDEEAAKRREVEQKRQDQEAAEFEAKKIIQWLQEGDSKGAAMLLVFADEHNGPLSKGYQDSNGMTMLHHSAHLCWIDCVKPLLNMAPELVGIRTYFAAKPAGWLAIHSLLDTPNPEKSEGRQIMIAILTRIGNLMSMEDLTSQTGTGSTVWHMVASRGHHHLVGPLEQVFINLCDNDRVMAKEAIKKCMEKKTIAVRDERLKPQKNAIDVAFYSSHELCEKLKNISGAQMSCSHVPHALSRNRNADGSSKHRDRRQPYRYDSAGSDHHARPTAAWGAPAPSSRLAVSNGVHGSHGWDNGSGWWQHGDDEQWAADPTTRRRR
jgi:hypothetical protein